MAQENGENKGQQRRSQAGLKIIDLWKSFGSGCVNAFEAPKVLDVQLRSSEWGKFLCGRNLWYHRVGLSLASHLVIASFAYCIIETKKNKRKQNKTTGQWRTA